MDAWLVWLIVGVAAAVGELLTTGFFLAPFALGAFAAMVAGIAGASGAIQLVAFLVLSLAVFGVVRPIARRHLYTPPQIRTGTAALVGSHAVVLQRIDNDAGGGQVRIDGDVWTARAYDDEVIEPGSRVQVIEIRGATALVAP